MRTDYLGLEAFVAISELGSFNRAAAYLNLSRTALSHRITKLESDLGVQLLLRSSRDVSLTKEAQALLPEIRRDLTRLSEAYAALSNRGRDKQERLRFACVPTFAYSYLPAILHAFSAERPDIVVQLQDQPVARIYDLVREGDVEFGISIVGARHSDLDIREIYTEPYVLLVRRDHPLAARESVTRADLAGQPFVRIRTQSSNRQLVDDALGDYRDQIIWRYEVQNPAVAMSLVGEGAALTVLPALTASLAWQDLAALRFSDADMKRTLGVITRRGAALSEPGERLLAMITDRLSQS